MTAKKKTAVKKENLNENVEKAKKIVEQRRDKITKTLDELSITELKAAIFDRQEQINYISREIEILRSVLAKKINPQEELNKKNTESPE